jgi:hypothetical protein
MRSPINLYSDYDPRRAQRVGYRDPLRARLRRAQRRHRWL